MLCLDPGDTTGYAVFAQAELRKAAQFRVQHLADFARLIDWVKPAYIVAENYRVYAHRLKQHTNSTVPTIQYIGAIKLMAELREIPLTLQWAFQAKGFGTDRRLKALDLYQVNKPHANDAIRHAVYWYVFHKDNQKSGLEIPKTLHYNR